MHAIAGAERYIRDAYAIDRRLTSLATKFLWLRYSSPIPGYDRRARTALSVPERDLPAFEDAWRARFFRDRAAIREACGQLPAVLRFALRAGDDADGALVAIRSAWFHERVLDHALWQTGGRGGVMAA